MQRHEGKTLKVLLSYKFQQQTWAIEIPYIRLTPLKTRRVQRAAMRCIGTNLLGQVVKIERHVITVDTDFENTIDRLPKMGQFIERTAKQLLLGRTLTFGMMITRPPRSGCAP